MSSRVYVPPSDDTLFMRGFSSHHRPEQIKDFFGKEAGRCVVEFNKDDGNEGQYIALRFQTREIAKDVYRRFNDREIMGDRVTMTWYKDLRRVKQTHDTRRFSGGRSGHYDYYNDNRNDHHRFRRSSGNRGRMHHDVPRHMSRSISRSSRSVSSSGSYESGEVPKRHASRSSSVEQRNMSKRSRRHENDSSESMERKRMKRMKRMMRRQADMMDYKHGEKDDNVISIEADEPDNSKAPVQPPKDDIREVSKEELNTSVNNSEDLTKLNKIHDVEVEHPSKQVINEDDDGAEEGEDIDGMLVEMDDVASFNQEHHMNQIKNNENKMQVLKEKKAQVEKAYRQDCETIVMVTKLLISKDPDLEDRLQKSLRENLRDIGHRCIQEMRDYVDRMKQ